MVPYRIGDCGRVKGLGLRALGFNVKGLGLRGFKISQVMNCPIPIGIL